MRLEEHKHWTSPKFQQVQQKQPGQQKRWRFELDGWIAGSKHVLAWDVATPRPTSRGSRASAAPPPERLQTNMEMAVRGSVLEKPSLAYLIGSAPVPAPNTNRPCNKQAFIANAQMHIAPRKNMHESVPLICPRPAWNCFAPSFPVSSNPACAEARPDLFIGLVLPHLPTWGLPID